MYFGDQLLYWYICAMHAHVTGSLTPTHNHPLPHTPKIHPRLDGVRVPPHHQFTLVLGCLMVEVWSEKLCSGGNLNLFLYAVPFLHIVVHLFSLLKEKVLIMLKVRDASKMGILCDNWSVFHISLPFWHIELRHNGMIPWVLWDSGSTVCKQISPKIVGDRDGSLLVRHL